MIKRPIQRSVWVLLILNALALVVVTLDWRADQVRLMSGSVQGLTMDPGNEIMIARPIQGSASVIETPLPESPLVDSPPVMKTPLGTTSSPAEAVNLSPIMPDCVRIGPFSEDQRARISDIKPDIPSRVWMTQGPTESKLAIDDSLAFRVYAGPADSLNAAYQLLKGFRDQGFDSFVLTDGPLARSVSLGVFSSYASAERFVNAIPVAERASLAIHSPDQSNDTSYLQLRGAEIDWIDALEAAGLMAPTVSQKPCSEPAAKP